MTYSLYFQYKCVCISRALIRPGLTPSAGHRGTRGSFKVGPLSRVGVPRIFFLSSLLSPFLRLRSLVGLRVCVCLHVNEFRAQYKNKYILFLHFLFLLLMLLLFSPCNFCWLKLNAKKGIFMEQNSCIRHSGEVAAKKERRRRRRRKAR